MEEVLSIKTTITLSRPKTLMAVLEMIPALDPVVEVVEAELSPGSVLTPVTVIPKSLLS